MKKVYLIIPSIIALLILIMPGPNSITYNSGYTSAKRINVIAFGAIKKPNKYHFKEGTTLEYLLKEAGQLDITNVKAIDLNEALEDGANYEFKFIDDEISTTKESIKTPVFPDFDGFDKNGKLNINTASKEQLMALSSIGSKRAEDIISYRKLSIFKGKEDIKNVKGISDKIYDTIKDSIIV